MAEDEKVSRKPLKRQRLFVFGCQASFGTRRSAWAMSSSAWLTPPESVRAVGARSAPRL